MKMRQAWICKEDGVAMVRQCALAGVSRAWIFAQREPGPVDGSDLPLLSVSKANFSNIKS